MVPARVRVALEYLSLLTSKTMVRAAVNDMAIQEIPGQELSSEEVTAQATACNMLSFYFAGKMPADYWERLDAEDRAYQRGEGGELSPCFNCRGINANTLTKNCHFCRGNGFVFVTPAVMEEVATAEQLTASSEKDE
jgi:hypothetical protein